MALKQPDRYYHSRAAPRASAAAPSAAAPSTSAPEAGPSQRRSPAELPSFMNGVRVFFYNLPASERKTLSRYLVTYPF